MCIGNLFKPKIPEVEPMAPPPQIKPEPEKPDAPPETKDIKEEGEKADVTYGSSPKASLLSGNQGNNASVINLNRNSLNSAGANQQGLGGGTTA